LPLDDNMKQLLKELGHAINDTVSDSERVVETISKIRGAGFGIVLRLDATVTLAPKISPDAEMPTQQGRFLESLHIRVDG
jgi:hypothetical protein